MINNLPSVKAVEISRVQSLDEKPKQLTHMDTLAVEEPLEIRIEFGPLENRTRKSISITMRTPGHDFELAVGFLCTEGILQRRDQLRAVEFCGPSRNVVRVELNPDVEFNLQSLDRHFYTSSSCGVCGKSSIEALRVQNPHACISNKAQDFSIPAHIVHQLPFRLREAQGIFDSTGGLHACAVFNLDGHLQEIREDVGRHNALDKLIGFYFLRGELPLRKHLLLVSGRASFELVQKAAIAGLSFFAAVGAPSSLAVELAKESQMTLVGFVRDQRFNIYEGGMRIKI